jgi:hypothetical protein
VSAVTSRHFDAVARFGRGRPQGGGAATGVGHERSVVVSSGLPPRSMVDEDGGVHAEGVRESPERGESTPLARPLSADACAVRAALEVIAMFRDSARWWWTLRV